MINLLKKIIPPTVITNYRLITHRGDKYECPFCGYRGKDLALLGINEPVLKDKQVIGGGIRNGSCHKCGSSDRDRLLFIFLKEEYKLFNEKNKNLHILHIAPEGYISREIIKNNLKNYICGDLFTEGYEYPSYVINMNVLNIPYEDNYFELILCNHVLEHITNDIDAMKELYRVLKPGGKGILQVPISKISETTFEDFSVETPEERAKIFGQFDHVRIYGQDYVTRLEQVGFKVNRINIYNKYKQFGLNPDEDLFVVEKM